MESQGASGGTVVMRTIRAGIFVLVALLVLIILAVVAIGAFLPQQHISTRAAQFHQPPDAIWQAITEYAKFPVWRKDVTRVEMLPPVNAKPSWREFDNHGGSIPYEVMVMVPPRVLVVRIADPKLPFGGTWTYEISSLKDGSSLLRITEAGEIYNPIFRVAARFVLGYSRTQEQYLQALGAKFGEPGTVEK
ncbi:MAG TPA: SRPBCC family protein [Candidatus Acidoferrales bacterium]|nr:SRPBCC family protein [Candidatus Acidoferrales bacterium]